LKKRTAARQQAESIQSSDKTPLGKNDDGTVTRASNFLRNKAAERRAVIDQQYGKDAYGGSGRYEADKAQGFNSWLESVNGLSSQLGSDYQSRDGKFQSAADFGKYRDDNDARISVMQNRANAYRTYFQDNREIYGEDAVNGVLSTLDQGSKYLEELRGGLNSEYDFWSQFKDENDYNTYQRGKEYAALAEKPDFAEKSQYKSTANGQEKFNAWSGTYSNSGFDDIAYDYINRNEEARSRQMLSDIQSNASLLGLDNSERREMTDDEIATFNYLYAQDSANGDAEHKNAYAYIDYLTGDLNYRQRAKAEEEWAAYAKEHPVGSSAFSVLESPLKGLSYLGQAADYLSDGEIDQNAGYNKFSYINSAIRNEVNTIVEDNWGGVGSFAYQTGMSMGDFLLNTAITGGNQALSLAIMGTGAAADATISAKDRGLSDNQAFALGTIAGAAEIITEKVSLDALLDKTALTKSAMGYFLKNTLAEGSEEVGSDIINLVADVLISKDKSEWQTSIDAYEAEGMTEKEAFWRAVRDQAENMGLDFLGGAVSGGVMSGAGIAINAGLNEYGARRTGAEFQAMGDDVVQATIQEGLASDPSTQSYKLAVQLQQKLDAGQTLTNAEIGRLYQANVQAIDAEDGSGDLLLRAAEEVTQKGRVTNNTAIDILSNPTAINTLTQEAGLNISEDMSKSQQRKAVKNAVATLARTQSDVSTNARETAPAATEARQAATQETVRPAMQVEQQRPAAQQAYDIRRVRDAAASLGENGAKALSASYDGSVQADDYYAGFASYYEAGISGIDMDKVQSRYAAQLNQAQRFAAYSAGQNDAAASLALEREGVKSATVYGDEAGFVQSEHSASLPKETVRFYDSLARAAGVKIQMAEATGKGGANGWYSNGIIHIANDAENPGTVVAKHEITHRMQEMAPEAYRKYRDYAMSALTERDGSTASIVEQYKSRYAEAGVNLSTEQAMDEIAADFTEALTVDPARFETLAKENRSVARKLLDAVRDFIRKVKSLFKGNKTAQNQAAANAYGVSIDTLEEAARLWEEALKATSEQTANKNAAQTDGGTKFSIKRTSQMTLAQQLKMFYDGKMASSDAFYFGVTPAALEKSGFDALPLAMTIGDFRKSTQKKHNIPRRVLKNLMSNLASPLFSFGSGDRAGIVLNDIDGDGYTLLAALERGTDMDRKPVNVINSLYGLEHPAEWIKNQIDSGNEFALYDEKRANAFLQTYGYMASVGDGIRSTGESVTQNGAEVKSKFSLKTPVEETDKLLALHNKDALGDGFTVEPTRKFGAVSAIVTRDGDRLSLKGRDILRENAALQEENRLLREQMKDYIAIQRRNGKLQESRDYWQGQTRRTRRVTTDKKAVTAAAKQLIQNYGADIAVKDIQGDLQSLYDYIASGYDGKDELTYTEARRRAEDIAETLVSNAVAVDSDMYDAYSDLRDYLRTTKIIYGKEYHGDIADYGDFRKRQFGRLNLGSEGHTNIDQVYQELSSRWPEFFSEQEQTHPTDQLLHIVEVLDGISEINEYNPFSRYMDQAVTGAANEIMETFFDLPQARKTFADRQALKLENAKVKGREQVQKVREQYTTRLAELREQNRQRVQNAIAKEREARERQMGALKDRYAAKDAAGRERRAARELRAKITRHASALSQKLLRPSDQHHIPEAMRGSVAAMLESINQESQYTLDENGKRVKDGRGTPTKRTEAFRALKEQYAKIVAEGGDMVIDPSLLGSDADGIKGGFDAVIAMKDTKLADMSVAQLQTVWQVVKAVEHSVNTAGKVLSKAKYARTADWAQAISIGTSSRRAKNSLTRNHALIDLETPYTFFSHYGEAGKAVYRMLRDAQDQQQLMVDHVAEEVRKIVDPKTVKKLEATTHTFTTERGEKLTLSTAQVMELYELVKRKQAHDHLLKGGVVQPEIKTSQIRRGTDSIRLTEGDLVNITGTLTPEQVKIADGLQGLTRGVLADYGNKASMEAYGYKKFTESDYWPIKSAKEGLHSNIEKGGNNTRSIKNIGMAKTTIPHVSNALDLAGIFTTFANHASDMTDYASWLCTMEDINRLFNYQFRDEEGNPTGKTIKGLLDRVGGPGSQKYWHNLMEDIQNGINAPGDSPMWDIAGKTIGGFKGAAVGANIRVVIQQPTAFFRAAAVLDPQDMARGLARGVTRGSGWKKALQYSPIAMRKDAGGFDISSPYKMTETLFDNRTNVRKLNDALSAPAGAADAVTWGKLWNACEWATAREHQGLTKGSEAFYRQTAKLFAEVIDQTQVVDGVLQRSNIMRSSNAVVKQATSFMGEPIMSLNLLMRAYDQVRYEQNSQKRGKAIKTMGRAATALVVTNVVNALAQSLIDAMRDDDEDKKYWERFRAAFTGISGDEETPWEKAWNAIMEGNVGSNMNPLGQIPFVKDALSIMQGYDVSRTEMEIVSDLIQAGQTAIQSADGQGKRTRAYALKGLLAACAKMFGIPASNLTRDMWGLARSAAVETGNIPLQYEMEKAIYNISNTGNKNRYYAILYRALEQGDMDTYQHIRDDLMNSMGVDGASIDSAMRSRYNKAVEKDPDYTLPQRARDLIGSRDKYVPVKEKEETFGADDLGSSAYRAYSDQRANDYRSMADDLASSPIFRGMDDETRDKVLKAAYDLADKSALADHSDGQYEVSTKWMAQADDAEAQGIEPWEYVLFHTAYNEMEGTKDADGKTVKGEAKSDHVREWLEDFSGLTDEQRAFLWGTVYTSEW
jgi:hypothetical protein